MRFSTSKYKFVKKLSFVVMSSITALLSIMLAADKDQKLII